MRTFGRMLMVAIVPALLALPAGAENLTFHDDRTFDAIPNGSVLVDASFHDVEVTVTPGDSVRIVVELEVSGAKSKAERLMSQLEPRFDESGDQITVRSTRDSGGWSFGANRTSGHISVWLPPGMDVIVDNSSGDVELVGDFGSAELKVDNSSGEVRLNGAARAFHADNSSGGVQARVTRPLEFFHADCSSGSVKLTGGAHEANADTSSGSVVLLGLMGSARMDTSSGDVTASWVAVSANMKVSADTSSGDVSLSFPPGTALDARVDTSSGSIRSDFGGTFSEGRDSLKIKGGAGAVEVRTDTSSGDISLAVER